MNDMDETKKNGTPNLRQALGEDIGTKLTQYAMGAVQVPGQPPPPVMAFATAVEAAFSWAESAGMPRPLCLDVMFRVLFEREVIRAQMQQTQSLVKL